MEVSQESHSIVFESSSQDRSNSGIIFQARRSSCESVGTGSQAEGKQRSAQGTGLQSNHGVHLIKTHCNHFKSQILLAEHRHSTNWGD